MVSRLPHQMLAGAEADFEPDFLARCTEQRGEVDPLRLGRDRDQKLRQQRVEQALLSRPQLLAAPAAVERALAGPPPITTAIRDGPVFAQAEGDHLVSPLRARGV